MPIWPLLLALGGTGLQMAGARKSQKEADKAYSAEMERQKKYRAQAQAAFETNAAGASRGEADAAQKLGAERFKQGYDATEAIPLTTASAVAPLQKSATTTNTNREQRRQERTDTQRSNLMGFSEWELQRAIENLLAQQQMNLAQNYAGGSQNILPLELDAASRAGQSLQGMGSLLSTAGMMAGLGSAISSPAGTVAERAATFQANPALQNALVDPSLLSGATSPNWAFSAGVKPFSLFGGD